MRVEDIWIPFRKRKKDAGRSRRQGGRVRQRRRLGEGWRGTKTEEEKEMRREMEGRWRRGRWRRGRRGNS